MTDLIGDSDLAVLDPGSKRLGECPLPSERDEVIAALLDRIAQHPDVPAVRSVLNREQGDVLAAFAERLASLAVRDPHNGPMHLRRGLLALGLAFGTAPDYRDVMLVLPLLWRSAQILGLDPEHEFTEMGRIVGGLGKQHFDAFITRSEWDRRI